MKQGSERNGAWLKLLGGAALGTVAMYMFDPQHGRQRRALARDKMQSLRAKTGDAIDGAKTTLGNRLDGMQAQLRSMLGRRSDTADDRVLAARVRAKLGHAVSHPRAIEVTVQQGHLCLRGAVTEEEKQKLLELAQAIPGISDVEDKLEIRAASADSGMEGESGKSTSAFASIPENWNPALRGLAIAGGGALGLYGVTRRTPAALALAAVGLSLLARGASNRPLKRLAGIGTDSQTWDLHKTIEIDAPPETIFDIWSKYENFPRFMSHVLEVHDLGQQRSHWVVRGPAGTRVEWDAVLTEYRRPTALAWRTEPGATVAHNGSVRFEPVVGGTRVTVRMSYSPPAGALGQGIAVMLGSDPKRELDDDLMRMKNFVERGVQPHDAAKPAPEPGPFLH